MIDKFIQTVINLGKVVLKSNYFIRTEKSADQSVIVLGNGPSLQVDILNNMEAFEKSELAVVNHFCHSEFFFQLKPRNYFLLDPAFFVDSNPLEVVEKTNHILGNETDWEITFYIPYRSKKSRFVQQLRKQDQFKIQYVNYVPAKGGFRGVNHRLFNRDLATPQCQNVIIYTLFLQVRKGIKHIFLFGAENNWHMNVEVNKENYLVLRDFHLYKEKKEATEKVLFLDKEKTQRTTMVDLLESSVKVFKGYFEIEAYARKQNVKIYNCSKNSVIDAFERLDDDEFTKRILP